jgi:spore photoproduct lyase
MIERLNAAKQVYEKGYEVRLRIDPMVPVENWQIHYTNLVDSIFGMLKPLRVNRTVYSNALWSVRIHLYQD